MLDRLGHRGGQRAPATDGFGSDDAIGWCAPWPTVTPTATAPAGLISTVASGQVRCRGGVTACREHGTAGRFRPNAETHRRACCTLARDTAACSVRDTDVHAPGQLTSATPSAPWTRRCPPTGSSILWPATLLAWTGSAIRVGHEIPRYQAEAAHEKRNQDFRCA